MIIKLINIVLTKIADALNGMNQLDAIRLLLSAPAKFADLVDETVEGSRPDDKI
jgi:hypothetical protein